MWYVFPQPSSTVHALTLELGNKLPDGLAGNISSAGPEAGVTCFLYSKPYCTSDRSAPLVNPGYGDLSAIAFDKKAQSWQCWKWCGWMGTSSASSPTLTSSASNVEGFSERLVSVTTTIDGNAQTTATTTSSGLPAVPSSPSASSSSASTSQSAIFETSMTNIVVTHTYADGSTTVISSPLAIPVPVVTSDSSSTGSAVSITTTGGLASEGPVPSTTATTSDVGTSATTSATEVGTTASGVSITTTQGMPLPGLTITSEGVTIPVQLVSPSPSTSSNVEGQG